MLTQITKLITDSYRGHAIPSPAVYSRDSIKWCFQTAASRRSPLIVGIENEADMSLEEAAELTEKFSAMFSQVPAGLSLEHCESFETAIRAVMAGYTNIVMPITCDQALLKETAHLCRAMGARLEAAVELDCGLLDRTDELMAAVGRVQAGGILITGRAPKDAGETYEVGLARKLWALYDATALQIGIRGEIFTLGECLKLAARTGLSRVTFSESLSAAAVKAAVDLVSQPETDRRGLTKLQAAVQEGFCNKLASCAHLLNAHNRF